MLEYLLWLLMCPKEYEVPLYLFHQGKNAESI